MNLLESLMPTPKAAQKLGVEESYAQKLCNFLYQQLLQCGSPIATEKDEPITEFLDGVNLVSITHSWKTHDVSPLTKYISSHPITEIDEVCRIHKDGSETLLDTPAIKQFSREIKLSCGGLIKLIYHSYIPDFYEDRLLTALCIIHDDLGEEGIADTNLNTGVMTGFKADDTAETYSSRTGVVTKYNYLQSNRAVWNLLKDLCPDL